MKEHKSSKDTPRIFGTLPMNDSRIAELVSGSIFLRPNYLEKVGDKHPGHKHNFDHTTVLLHGAVHVKATSPEGEVLETDLFSPRPGKWDSWSILVDRDWEHEFTALEPDTFFGCVYSHRTPQGKVSVTYTGWREAYLENVPEIEQKP